MPSFLDAIDWGTELADNTVSYYFPPEGEQFWLYATYVSVGWSAADRAAFELAFEIISQYVDLEFVEVGNRNDADFKLVPSYGVSGGLAYGAMLPPGDPFSGIGVFDINDPSWLDGLHPGGSGFVTIVHELLHGLGLAHPHDDGGTSAVWGGSSIYDIGVFTTMSYNDGWGSVAQVEYGFQSGPMFFDIAALQAKYGANTTHASGNDTYELFDQNAVGAAYVTIWDAGGVDEIVYNGSRDAVIDLRYIASVEAFDPHDPSLSRAGAIEAGYFLYAGVVIENATGGSGDDSLLGNFADNTMSGRGGDDLIEGDRGDDTLDGGGGSDEVNGGSGFDTLTGGTGLDTLNGGQHIDTVSGGGGNDTIKGQGGGDTLQGDGGADVISGQGGPDTLDGGIGDDDLRGGAGGDTFFGGDGDDIINGGGGNDVIDGGADDDSIYAAIGADVVDGGDGADTVSGGGGADVIDGGAGDDDLDGGNGNDTLSGQADDDVLVGKRGNDVLDGGDGADVLIGGFGADTLTGGLGADTYVFEDTFDAGNGPSTRDVITDFARADGDTIDLSAIDADEGTGGDQAFTVVGAFSNTAGELVLTLLAGTTVEAQIDVDGDGKADMTFNVTGQADLGAADFIL